MWLRSRFLRTRGAGERGLCLESSKISSHNEGTSFKAWDFLLTCYLPAAGC